MVWVFLAVNFLTGVAFFTVGFFGFLDFFNCFTGDFAALVFLIAGVFSEVVLVGDFLGEVFGFFEAGSFAGNLKDPLAPVEFLEACRSSLFWHIFRNVSLT